MRHTALGPRGEATTNTKASRRQVPTLAVAVAEALEKLSSHFSSLVVYFRFTDVSFLSQWRFTAKEITKDSLKHTEQNNVGKIASLAQAL